MRRKAAGNGSGLVQTVTCKICKEEIILPTAPPTIGDPDPRTTAFAVAFYKGIMQHIGKKHADMRPMSLIWSGLFSEFLILSMIDCANAPDMQTQYEVKRVQLHKVTESGRPTIEEEALWKELEEQGFKLATGFLNQEVQIVKS